MDDSERKAALDRLAALANTLDARFQVPGTRWRVGWDGLIGLLPGVGDTAMGLVSLWLVAQARRLGAPVHVILRMLLNIAVDFALGSVPLVGDLFDIAFKVNQRNIQLLSRSLEVVADN